MNRLLAIATVALLAASCSSDDGGSDGPLSVISSSGNNQWAAPGAPLPAPIAVKMGHGTTPAAGIEVTFHVLDGSLSNETVTTGADGVASTVWTLPTGATARFLRGGIIINDEVVATFTAFVVPAGNTVVTVQNNVFTPQTPTIGAGQTVTWLWFDGAVGHNVTPVGVEPVRSGELLSGPNVYSYTFPTSGNYTYYCEAHGGPTGTGMAGVIVVSPP